MGKLYLVRHGETVWNVEARYQGHTDTSLSEKGLQQAQKLQERFIREPIDAIFGSDLNRAAETARIIAKPKGFNVQLTASLRELSFGDWEGLTYDEIVPKHGDLIHKWYENPEGITVPGGEPLSSMIKRTTEFIYSLTANQPENSFIIVSHGGPIRAIVAKLNNIPFNKMWSVKIDNGSITTLETKKNKIETLEINNTNHLH